MTDREKCHCKCGYTCGRGHYNDSRCELPVLECMKKHWVRDCDHVWDGSIWTSEDERAQSVTCSQCEMVMIDHDIARGP